LRRVGRGQAQFDLPIGTSASARAIPSDSLITTTIAMHIQAGTKWNLRDTEAQRHHDIDRGADAIRS
jgi:hypothetical protein